jgi:hypothetical protein
MQYQSLDPHLNLFRRFGLPPGGQEYENNVTHALINTLRLSDPRVTRSVLTELVPEIASVPVDWTDIAWGLQRPPRSPEAFQNRVVLGLSVDGYTRLPNEGSLPQPPHVEVNLESEDTESASPDEQSRGIPDAWIYTKQTDALCLLIEVKTRGGIDPHQIQRHERTHFAEHGANFRKGLNDRQSPIAACCTVGRPHNIKNQTSQRFSYFKPLPVPKTLTTDTHHLRRLRRH